MIAGFVLLILGVLIVTASKDKTYALALVLLWVAMLLAWIAEDIHRIADASERIAGVQERARVAAVNGTK